MITEEDQRHLASVERHIVAQEARIQRLQRIKELADHDGWKALKEDIELSMRAGQHEIKLATELDNYIIDDPVKFMPRVRYLGGQQVAYKGVIQNVENADEKVSTINDQIADLRRKVKDIRQDNQPHPGKTPKPKKKRGIV